MQVVEDESAVEASGGGRAATPRARPEAESRWDTLWPLVAGLSVVFFMEGSRVS